MKHYATILISGFLLLVGCSIPIKPATMKSADGENYPALYMAPRLDEVLVPASTIEEYDLTFVSPTADIEHLLEKTNVIYLHPDAVGMVDKTTIRDAYRSEVTVVAINTPISKLADLLGVPAPFPDLRPLRAGIDGITIAMFHHNYDARTRRINGNGSRAEYYPSFDDFPQGVNTLLRLNHNPVRR
jgi:hypothetical protein